MLVDRADMKKSKSVTKTSSPLHFENTIRYARKVSGPSTPNAFFLADPFLQCFSFFKKKDFIYLFLERGREREGEGEKHQCVVASHVPPTGDLA